MQVKTNFRFDIGLVVERTTRLAEALEALPTRQDEVKAAIHELSISERAQVDRYLAELILQFYGILDSLEWMQQWMETHYGR